MKQEDKIWPVIARFLGGSATDSDKKRLRQWLSDDERNKQVLKSVEKIWKASGDNVDDDFLRKLEDLDDWQILSHQIRTGQSGIKSLRTNNYNYLSRRKNFFSTVAKIAAILLVAAVSGYISWQYATDSMPETSEPVFKEITTPRGERANIQLGDGSKIILNSDSRLTMPEKFSHSRRIVKLKGQAFFEVAPNSTHPFIVVTNGMEVEVLGTSFDVSSYENDDKFHVAVSEGSVIFRNTERPEDHVQLNSGEVGIFSRTNAVFTKKAEEDLSMYMGWRTGRLIFKNASIVEVVNRIERWYDISIVLQMSEERRAEKKLTADLKTKSIRELMDVIRASTGLEYEMDDDHIILR